MSEHNTDAQQELPYVLVVDEDPDWRALAELHVRLAEGVRLLGSVTSLPQAMDVILAAEPDIVLIGLGRPNSNERTDLTLLRMLAPTVPLVVASIRGAGDARARADGIEGLFVDKIEVEQLVDALTSAAASVSSDARAVTPGSPRGQSDQGSGAS